MPFSDLDNLPSVHGPSPEPSIYPKPMTRLPTPLHPTTITATTTTRSTHTAPTDDHLPPYLSLRARLSLTILSLPLLSLLLALTSFLSSTSSAQSRTSDAKAQLLATCRGVEQGVKFMVDGGMTRVVADKVNEGVVRGVRGSLGGLHLVLEMSLTIIEKVVGFMIDMYRSLLMCTIEFVVRGALAILIGAVKIISDGITSTLNTIRSSIQADINSANQVISTALKAINSVTSIVNVNLSIPVFTIPSLDALANVTLPSGFEDDLKRLNESIPTLDEFRSIVKDIIGVPFEKLREEMNETFTELMGNITVNALPTITNGPTNSTNPSLLSHTDGQTTFDLCGQMDTSFLDEIASSLSHLAKIATGLLILAFLLLRSAMIAWEWFTWRRMQEQAGLVEELVERRLGEGKKVDGLRLVRMVEYPVVETYGGMVVRKMTRTKETSDNLRWFFAYITHPPTLILLGFGILTFVTMQIQLSAVHAIRIRSTEQANSAIAAQTQSLGEAINQAMLAQSQEYAIEMNAVMRGWQEDIDTTIYGPWLNTTTVTLNNTLVEFYDKVESVLDATFGNTVLANSVNGFVYCILGSKIDSLATALTWINDNAHVTLPTFDPDVLMLSASTMNDVAEPIAQAAVGGGSSDGSEDPGIIGKLFDRYEDELRKQRNIAAIFIGLYGAVILIGLAVLVWHTWLKRPFNRWRLQRRGEDDRGPSTGPVHPDKTNWTEKPSGQIQAAADSQPDYSVYSLGGANRSQQSFFDGPDGRQSFSESPKPFGQARSTQTMAERLRALSPIKRDFSHDNYEEPMLSQPAKAGPAPTTWQSKLGQTFGGLLTVPAFTSGLARQNSQKSQQSESSWAGASTSPGPSKIFNTGTPGSSATPTASRTKLAAGKPVPSPLQSNPFSIGDYYDDDAVGTPIAARFSSDQNRRQPSMDGNPFANPYGRFH